jgi:hypothetical protein
MGWRTVALLAVTAVATTAQRGGFMPGHSPGPFPGKGQGPFGGWHGLPAVNSEHFFLFVGSWFGAPLSGLNVFPADPYPLFNAGCNGGYSLELPWGTDPPANPMSIPAPSYVSPAYVRTLVLVTIGDTPVTRSLGKPSGASMTDNDESPRETTSAEVFNLAQERFANRVIHDEYPAVIALKTVGAYGRVVLGKVKNLYFDNMQGDTGSVPVALVDPVCPRVREAQSTPLTDE